MFVVNYFSVASSYTAIVKYAGSLPPTGDGLFLVYFGMLARCSLVNNLMIRLVLSLSVSVSVHLYLLSSRLLIFLFSPISYTMKY